MTAPNFKALLQKNLDEVKKPEALPEGSYRGIIRSYKFDESSKKKTPYVQFEVVPQEAMDGVDTDDLAVALQGEPLSTKKLRSDFYITDEALFRLKDFIASCGIEIQGRTLDEVIPDMKGQEVLFDVQRKPSEDGSSFYNNIGKIVGSNA